MRFRRLPKLSKPALVSVVVPCYRYGNYVGEAVRSAIEQAGVDVEVIVVDDASPDDSPARIAELTAKWSNVRAIYHEVNKRHIATYNDGLAEVQGDYVVLLSADDMLAPDSFARSVSIMQRYPNIGFVYGFAPDFDQVPVPTRELFPHCTLWSGEQWIRSTARSGENPVSTPTAILRRDIFDRIGGYDEALPHSGDLLMWLQAASMADVGYVSGADLAYYRVHGANMHTTRFGTLGIDLAERARAFETFDTFADGSRVDRARVLRQARLALAREASAALDLASPADELDRESLHAFVEDQLALAGGGTTRRFAGRVPRRFRDVVTPVLDALNWRVWRRFGIRW